MNHPGNPIDVVSSIVAERYHSVINEYDKRTGEHKFDIYYKGNSYRVMVKKKKHFDFNLPHVHDFVVCHCCQIKFRAPHSYGVKYCKSCGYAKQILCGKGINIRTLGRKKLHELIRLEVMQRKAKKILQQTEE